MYTVVFCMCVCVGGWVGGLCQQMGVFKNAFPSVEIVPTPCGSILHPTRASQVPYDATIYVVLFKYV